MNIKKINETYEINDDKYVIEVTVSNEFGGTKKVLSIKSKKHGDNFRFIISKPETVEAIGRLLIEASKL